MLALILRRLIQMALIMAVASLILFVIFDTEQFKKKIAVAELGGFAVSALTEESYQNWLAQKGLDAPFYERFVKWVGDVVRGDAVVEPGRWRPTRRLDASLEVLAGLDHEVSRRGAYVAYLGSGEVPVKVRVLGSEAVPPGGRGFVRAGVARNEQRVLVAVVEQRELRGVVDPRGFLRAQRERQKQADPYDVAPAHERRGNPVPGLHLRFRRRHDRAGPRRGRGGGIGRTGAGGHQGRKRDCGGRLHAWRSKRTRR